MLRGLSPKRLCADELGARGAASPAASGSWPRRSPSSTPSTLPLQIVPALAAALLAGCRRSGSRARPGFGDRRHVLARRLHVGQRGSRPTGGAPLPGVTDLLAFLFVVLAMFAARGRASRTRRSWSSSGLPEVPRPEHLLEIAAPVAVVARGRAGRPALRLPPGEVNTMIGDRAGALAGRDHRLRRAGLGRPAEPGRRHGLRDLAARATTTASPFPIAPIAGVAAAVVLGLADRASRRCACAASAS